MITFLLWTLGLVGIYFCPRVTLSLILCYIGYPVLGIATLCIAAINDDTKRVNRTKYIDSNTGQVVKEIESDS